MSEFFLNVLFGALGGFALRRLVRPVPPLHFFCGAGLCPACLQVCYARRGEGGVGGAAGMEAANKLTPMLLRGLAAA